MPQSTRWYNFQSTQKEAIGSLQKTSLVLCASPGTGGGLPGQREFPAAQLTHECSALVCIPILSFFFFFLNYTSSGLVHPHLTLSLLLIASDLGPAQMTESNK